MAKTTTRTGDISKAEAIIALKVRLADAASYSGDELEITQQLLNIAGFDVGPADKIMGPDTANGIANFLLSDEGFSAYGIPQEGLDAISPHLHTNKLVEVQSYYANQDGYSYDLNAIKAAIQAPYSPQNNKALQSTLNNNQYAVGRADGILGAQTAKGLLDVFNLHPELISHIDPKTLEVALSKAPDETLSNLRGNLNNKKKSYIALKDEIEAIGGNLDGATKAEIKVIQAHLKVYGLYPGKIDGIAGKNSFTQKGFEKFIALPTPADVEPLNVSVDGEREDTALAVTPAFDGAAMTTAPTLPPVPNEMNGAFGLAAGANSVGKIPETMTPDGGIVSPEAPAPVIVEESEVQAEAVVGFNTTPPVLKDLAPEGDNLPGILSVEDMDLAATYGYFMIGTPYASDYTMDDIENIDAQIALGTLGGQKNALATLSGMTTEIYAKLHETGQQDLEFEVSKSQIKTIHAHYQKLGKEIDLEISDLPEMEGNIASNTPTMFNRIAGTDVSPKSPDPTGQPTQRAEATHTPPSAFA